MNSLQKEKEPPTAKKRKKPALHARHKREGGRCMLRSSGEKKGKRISIVKRRGKKIHLQRLRTEKGLQAAGRKGFSKEGENPS